MSKHKQLHPTFLCARLSSLCKAKELEVDTLGTWSLLVCSKALGVLNIQAEHLNLFIAYSL